MPGKHLTAVELRELSAIGTVSVFVHLYSDIDCSSLVTVASIWETDEQIAEMNLKDIREVKIENKNWNN